MRRHLSYSNVVATLALFIALGGSSYAALNLPRNSVGPNQIRAKAVRAAEIRSSAVKSRHLARRAVSESKLSRSALKALRGNTGPQGPAGPAGPSSITLKTSIDQTGRRVRGDESAGSSPEDIGQREVSFGRSVRGCVATATLAKVDEVAADPPPGRITVRQDGDNVFVRTFDANGNLADLGFNLIVAC